MSRLLFALLVVLSAACSPEAGRTRAGGPGADTGNRGKVIDLHGTQDMFHETPRKAPGR